MRRRLRVAGLVALLVFGALVFAVPAASRATLDDFDPDRCEGRELSVVPDAREPGELDEDRAVASYGNLTATQRDLFDRGRRADEPPALEPDQFEAAESFPRFVVRGGEVYRVSVGLTRCPLVAGIPPAFNPVLGVFLAVNEIVTGPLAPVIVVVGGVGLAFWAGRQLEY